MELAEKTLIFIFTNVSVTYSIGVNITAFGRKLTLLAPSRFPAFLLKCPTFFAYLELEKCALCARLRVKWNSDDSATSLQCSAKLIRYAKSTTVTQGHDQ